MTVELTPVAEPDKPVLANLVQLYLYDFSEIRDDLKLSPHGTFIYRYLDTYFTEPDREAYFIMADAELAGFAMVRSDVDDDGSWNVAEFFVARQYRRRGVATEAARSLFALHPGEWTLTFDHANKPAVVFWRSVATEPYIEIGLPDDRTRLRFLVE
ncbi:GNAT family N-acetyltransferase [Kibdelosporangium philippinense]|uniref:GNAT family N-acetyltransferase n=1 Tax=Kibdelosporangium philippinense TaxID=211113 RepID=A0ABS8ZU94_9PSEU|nr:GNAT family N-acetyltransferase [Kibdelosporangium philippinense]MCE7010555.1 GNAT family N-acetyltransferase [Kibdelosporangium philippinense]